jgi:signal transduction histidine kinase
MKPRRHSLRGRIVLAMVGGVLATSLIFGLAAFTIAYTMEDRLFRATLTEEITYQKASWQRTGALAAPSNPEVAVYRDSQALPADIRQDFAENPRQSEFYGRDGRHYHVQRFVLANPRQGAGTVPAVAVIEVSRDLLVRPYRDSIIVLLAGIGLVIALFMAGIGWWLVHRAMKPLSDLAADVANAETTIPVLAARNYPANEVGILADALEQAFGRIRGFVDREQTFTRDASHELRTPLAVARGAAEVIALNRDLPPQLLEPLRRIETATTDMTLALDQLLALARENQGLQRERVALRPLIDKAVTWSGLRYPTNTMTVVIEIADEATAYIHRTSLQLVLNNLIGNCFQHVDSGQLTVALSGNRLSICDDGPGLNSGADPFALFVKSPASQGSGLGLDITRRLCAAAGIGLIVEQGKSGRGANFCLTFADP